MSRNTPRTSHSSSNDAHIPRVIDKSWLMQESPGLKPDWFVKRRQFIRKLKISLEVDIGLLQHPRWSTLWWKPLTIITKSSILDAAAVIDPPMRYITDVQVFSHISGVVRLACTLLETVCHFFHEVQHLFFHSSGKIPRSKHDLKIFQRCYMFMGHKFWTFVVYFIMTMCFRWI